LSQVLLLEGKVEEAVEFGNTALQIDPRYVPAIVSRSHLYVAQGALEAARVGFEKLLLFDEPMLRAFGMSGMASVGFMSGGFDAASRDMDEAIRLAMNAESTRSGLVYAFRLIDYLCELGRSEAAAAVLDRWVTRFGNIPTSLGQLRILISLRQEERVREHLDRIRNAAQWHRWMRILGIDYTDVYALSLIRQEDFAGALEVIAAEDAKNGHGGRRSYLKGYASFERGAAEEAAEHFRKARLQLRSIEFPYDSDPVLNVQSVFFLAETALARGESEEAARFYTDFLGMWGDADWELQAVERARKKLETLSAEPSEG
jgi:tetratricopeptide (TPR) repeat protein